MNKKIRILRGISENIAKDPSKTLAAGQPLYNIDKNYLTIGSLKNGNEQPLSQLPITVREINGWYDDNDQITSTKNDSYRVGPTESGTLSLNAKNGIEFTVRQSATGGQAMAGGGSVGTPLIITPNTLKVNGTIALDSSSFTIEDGKHWHSSININSGAIRSIDFTEDGDTRGAGLFLNDFGGDIYTGGSLLPSITDLDIGSTDNKFKNIYISDTLNASTIRFNTNSIINATQYSGNANTSSAVNSLGQIQAETGTTTPSRSGISMAEAYDNGYPTTYGNVLRLMGTNAAGAGELLIGWAANSGDCAPCYIRSKRDVKEAEWSKWTELVLSGIPQTISGHKVFDNLISFNGAAEFNGTGNNMVSMQQAFINACGMYTLNVHTINLQTTTNGNGDNIVNVPSIVNPGTGSGGGGNIGYA